MRVLRLDLILVEFRDVQSATQTFAFASLNHPVRFGDRVAAVGLDVQTHRVATGRLLLELELGAVALGAQAQDAQLVEAALRMRLEPQHTEADDDLRRARQHLDQALDLDRELRVRARLQRGAAAAAR